MNRYRHEYKYLINSQQEQILMIRAAGVMQRDIHAGENGTYFIRSLYFDDDWDTCLAENISGTDPRSKFRIRYYNNDTDLLRLEKKSKTRSMTLKESCVITKEECQCFMSGEIPELREDMPQVKKRLFLEMQLRNLKPKVIVTYERVPFIYAGGNVRVTFDQKITSSSKVEAFLTGDYPVRPILPVGYSVLEVKWDELLPMHIKEILNMDTMQWSAFSKYSLCRQLHL